jgi:two-component system chemotaxis sensor kinase CheA
MDEKNKEFQKRLRATFRMEAAEHIRAISIGLVDLEKNPGTEKLTELIESIFREAHSLKGAARSVDLRDVEAVCQPLEGAFSALKRREIALSPVMFDLFHRTINIIEQLISSSPGERTPADRSNVRVLIRQLVEAAKGPVPEGALTEPGQVEETAPGGNIPDTRASGADQQNANSPSADKQINVDTVRIPAARLDAILLQAEEMILVKMAAERRVAELKEIDLTLTSWKMASPKWQEKLSVPETRYDEIMTASNETNLNTLQYQMAAVSRNAEQDFRTVKRMVDEHLESMKQVMLLPVATLTEAFPKIVRDLARDQNKEVELVIQGAEVEIDKRILEELKDPFIHLLRNCIDHSIRKPEERTGQNKAPKGIINLIFKIKDGRQLEILVSDDGEGIDTTQIQEAAIKAGLMTRDAAGKLGEPEILSLIFKSGITTSPIITDISGRGLGLAIVREKAEKLGGTVSVRTQSGVGTTFCLMVPLTLATFRGITVRVDQHVFVLPTLNVERVKMINREEITTMENREMIRLDGRVLSLVRLGDALELSTDSNTTTDKISIVVIVSGDTHMAFQVDDILDEQQVLVKGLGSQLRRVRNIAGATVLATGRVVPILNVPDLVKSAMHLAAAVRITETVKKAMAKAGRILVAEDSITSRTLIKNILETAGFKVSTAVDGLDAFTQARSDKFDLVVSDVDMPRMSGFELTSKIRSDKKLGELPVVLVTALESREDRERGIEVGANAYIVKSSFDQSNLLEVVKRLI